MEDMFRFADELGPFKIIHIYEPSVDLKAVLVVDNIARGPALGGVRIALDVSTEECFRLARAMTLKNAAADLPYGGGKIVMYGDPRMPQQEKIQKLRALASALRYTEEYIFAPDMGTNEICMACIKDEIGRVVGLPCEVGGIPLDEVGATGWGLAQATEVALQYCDFELKGARVVIQGFGAVGKHTARFLTQRGAILVGVADSQGAIHNPNGLDVDTLIRLKNEGKNVLDYPEGKKIESDAVLAIPCEIWIPAARPDVINESNVNLLDTKLIIEGANIPITETAEKILYDAGILYVPDFIANAGGVICAASEYQGATQCTAFGSIEEKVRNNTAQVLEAAKTKGILPREAAVQLAVKRVKRAMEYRRWSIFSSAPHFV